MFENFPYTDMHQLNLDWIVKIAKDFLDQYTSLQQMIAAGETSLTNLTTEGLEQLQNKADHLQSLLDQWYNTHSSDIANQLAAALADIQATLNTAINNFNSAADAKAAQTIASIPADYTELSNAVEKLNNALCGITKAEKSPIWNAGHYYQIGSSATTADINNPTGSSDNYASVYFPCEEGDIFLVTSLGSSGARCFAFLSSASGSDNILDRAGSSQSTTGITNYRAVAPANAVYAIFNADIRSPYYVYKLNPTLDYLEDCMTEEGESWT